MAKMVRVMNGTATEDDLANIAVRSNEAAWMQEEVQAAYDALIERALKYEAGPPVISAIKAVGYILLDHSLMVSMPEITAQEYEFMG